MNPWEQDWSQPVTASAPDMTPLVQKLEGSGDTAVSPKGAVGRYQIMPGTAKQYGFDPAKLTDPIYNHTVATRILTDLHDRYKGDKDSILVAYNAGPGVANKWLAANKDPKLLPDETRNYLARANGRPAGQVEAGNINLNNRPVVKNPDGSISTVRSISVGIDGGRSALIPTISPDGKNLQSFALQHPYQPAIDRYHATGEHLGIFDNETNATAYAKQLHEDQAKQYAAPQIDANKAPWEQDWPVADSAVPAPEDKGGLFRNLVAGAGEFITGTPGFLADLGAAQANAESGYMMMPDHGSPVGVGGEVTHAINTSLDPVGLNPEAVTSDTFWEKAARMTGMFLMGGASGGGRAALTDAARTVTTKTVGKTAANLGKSALKSIPANVAGGTAAAAAEEAVPDPLKPLAAMIAGVAAHAGTTAGAKVLARPATSSFIASFSKSAAKNRAARDIAEGATDLPMTNAMLDLHEASGGENVPPGFRASVGEISGDKGLLDLQRRAETAGTKVAGEDNPLPFRQFREEQNANVVEALKSTQQGGSPVAASTFIRSKLDAFDKETEAHVAGLLKTAQDKAEAARLSGTPTPPEAHGQAIRDAADEADKAAKLRENAFWERVVPDAEKETMTGNMQGTTAAAQKISKAVRPYQSQMKGVERDLFEQAQSLQPVDRVQNLIDLRSEVSTAMREELSANGNSASYRRLSQLRGAIGDNLSKTIGDEIAAGSAEGRAAAERIRGYVDEQGAQAGNVGEAGVAREATGGTVPPAGPDGAPLPQEGRPAGTTGAQGLPPNAGGAPAKPVKPPPPASGIPKGATKEERAAYKDALEVVRAAAKETRPLPSSLSAIRKKGGFETRTPGGAFREGGQELETQIKAAAKSKKNPRGINVEGLINNKGRGLPPDDMRRALEEDRWFVGKPNDGSTTIRDLRELIDPEFSGTKVYHPESGSEALARDRAMMEEELGRAGVTARDPPAVAARKLYDFRREGTETLTPEGGADADFEGLTASSAAAPTVDAGLGSRLQEATDATRERARTYRLGPVGQILRRAGMQDLFRLPEAAVPGKFFHTRPTGYEDAQALYKAVGQARGEALLTDAAASSFQKVAMREDGTVDTRKAAIWEKNHRESLRALPPEVRAQFADASSASQAVQDAGIARAEQLKNMQKGAIRHIMDAQTDEDATRMIGGIFGRQDAVATMRALAKDARGDKAAIEGLRQGMVDHMIRKFISVKESGTSGIGEVRSRQLRTFLRDQRDVLGEVFNGAELDNFDRVATALEQADRSIEAVRIPGGPNTARDLLAARRGSTPTTNWRLGWDFLVGKIGSHVVGKKAFLPFMVVGDIAQSMRNAGIRKSDEWVAKALLDPKFFRELSARPAAVNGRNPVFAKAVRRAFIPAATAAIASSEQKRQ